MREQADPEAWAALLGGRLLTGQPVLLPRPPALGALGALHGHSCQRGFKKCFLGDGRG